MILTGLTTGEVFVLILLVVVLGIGGWYFLREIKKQKAEIKDLEDKANKRKEERAARRRKY